MDELFKKWRHKPPQGVLSLDEFDALLKNVKITGPFKVYRVYHQLEPDLSVFEIDANSKWDGRRAWIKCKIITPPVEHAPDSHLFFPDELGFNVRFIFKNYWFAYAHLLKFTASLTR